MAGKGPEGREEQSVGFEAVEAFDVKGDQVPLGAQGSFSCWDTTLILFPLINFELSR
jgi:hypothetical protein